MTEHVDETQMRAAEVAAARVRSAYERAWAGRPHYLDQGGTECDNTRTRGCALCIEADEAEADAAKAETEVKAALEAVGAAEFQRVGLVLAAGKLHKAGIRARLERSLEAALTAAAAAARLEMHYGDAPTWGPFAAEVVRYVAVVRSEEEEGES